MEAKERIFLKAHELFNRYGVRSVSMDDIAVGLGMSKKTVYQFYADKEELVAAVFLSIINTNKDRCMCDRMVAENAIHEVYLAFDMMQEMFAKMNPVLLFDLQKYHPQVYAKFLEHKNNFLYTMIRTNLEKGITEGLYRPEIDVDVMTRFRIESVFLPFDSDTFPTNRTHLVHIEQQILEHFLFGVVTAKGQKLVLRYKNQRSKN